MPVDELVVNFLHSWLMLKGTGLCESCYPWVSGSGAIEKQTVKPIECQPVGSLSIRPLHQFLPPDSCLEFLPLFPINNELWYGSVNWNNPFHPQVAFGHSVFKLINCLKMIFSHFTYLSCCNPHGGAPSVGMGLQPQWNFDVPG